MNLIHRWHSYLDMPKNDLDWHRKDIEDELLEFKQAKKFFDKWSEISDVVYTYTRAKWSGHTDINFPLSRSYFYVGLLYMFPKYTLRWRFFRAVGKKIDSDLNIKEVRNPRKSEKLDVMAEKYNLDKIQFKTEVNILIKKWILLK